MMAFLSAEIPHWKLAYRNLLRQRRRSLATGVAVVFGFAGLLLLGAYIYRTEQGLRASAVYINLRGHVAIRKVNSLERFSGRPVRFALSKENQDQVERALAPFKNEIEFIGRFLTGPALLLDARHSAPVLITGVEPSLYTKLLGHANVRRWASDWLPAGTSEEMAKMQTDAHLISITTRLAEKIGRARNHELTFGTDPDVQVMGKNYFGDLNVVEAKLGLHHATGVAQAEDTSVVAPISLLQDLFATDGVEYMAVFLRDFSATKSLVQNLRGTLGSDFEVFAYSDEKWSPQYAGTSSFLRVMTVFFTVLILGSVALAIANTVTLNLLERTQEIGTLRAIGFNPAEMRAAFLRESAVLCAFCLAAGLLISLVIGLIVNAMDIRFRPPGTAGEIQFHLDFDPPVSLAMSALMFFIVIMSTYTVVRRKSRVKIVELLNETGA
ncbi:MAG: FtsX-like permease family protein [Bdellovibrionota bacterium]